MSSVRHEPHIQLVDSVDGVADLLSVVQGCSTIYVDLEGVTLGRNGSLSLITIYDDVSKTVFVVDVLVLKDSAFSTRNAYGNSLKTVLETSRVSKVFFDVRNDSDALYTHYQISLQGVRDVQLMELAARQGSREFVHGLSKCIENDAPLSWAQKEQWKQSKAIIRAPSNLAHDNKYEIFNKRSLEQPVLRYCAADVVYLPALFNVYERKLSVEWREKVRIATEDRVKLSQSSDYDPSLASKVLGPWPDTSSHPDTSNEWFDQIEDDFFLNPDNEDYDDFDEWDDFFLNRDSEEYDDFDDWDDYQDRARDCIGWEEDMERNGSPF